MSGQFSELDEARECRAKDPYRALELANSYIRSNPDDAHGYFSRHNTLRRLKRFEESLADCSRSLALDPKCSTYLCRGEVLRAMGDHARALVDFNQAHDMDRDTWLHSFGPHLRSDTLARLGRLDEALEDTKLIREDHWMPEHDGLPGGNKAQFIAEIKRRAAAAGLPPTRSNS
jgi:tetratricopeptide (TPR) repeat protein